jgi:hypothetical protein
LEKSERGKEEYILESVYTPYHIDLSDCVLPLIWRREELPITSGIWTVWVLDTKRRRVFSGSEIVFCFHTFTQIQSEWETWSVKIDQSNLRSDNVHLDFEV